MLRIDAPAGGIAVAELARSAGRQRSPRSPLHVVVLAAGKGTRMKSGVPKVLHRAAGLPLIEHVLRAADTLAPASVVVVVGHQADAVRAALAASAGLSSSRCRSPSSAPAMRCCRRSRSWPGQTGTSCCSVGRRAAAARARRCERSSTHHVDSGRRGDGPDRAVSTIPTGYGRIVRDGRRGSRRSSSTRTPRRSSAAIREINSGIYAFDLAPLFARCGRSDRQTRRASTTFPTWSGSTASAGSTVETVQRSTTRGRSSA